MKHFYRCGFLQFLSYCRINTCTYKCILKVNYILIKRQGSRYSNILVKRVPVLQRVESKALFSPRIYVLHVIDKNPCIDACCNYEQLRSVAAGNQCRYEHTLRVKCFVSSNVSSNVRALLSLHK